MLSVRCADVRIEARYVLHRGQGSIRKERSGKTERRCAISYGISERLAAGVWSASHALRDGPINRVPVYTVTGANCRPPIRGQLIGGAETRVDIVLGETYQGIVGIAGLCRRFNRDVLWE